MKVRWMIPVLGFGLLAAAAQETAPQEAEFENLGKELVKKRAAVDSLSTAVELQKTDVQNQVRTHGLKKADLERNIKSLELEIAEIDGRVKKQEEEIARKEEPRGKLKPLVLKQIALARTSVATTLPFRTADRLKDLDELRSKVENGQVKPDEGLTRLWSAIEDELRLARENGLYRNPVRIDGQEVLAEVARIGMVLLYFKTSDNRTGMAVPGEDGKWTFSYVTDKAGQKQILYLFEGLQKRIKHGYFELPNPYAAGSPAK